MCIDPSIGIQRDGVLNTIYYENYLLRATIDRSKKQTKIICCNVLRIENRLH